MPARADYEPGRRLRGIAVLLALGLAAGGALAMDASLRAATRADRDASARAVVEILGGLPDLALSSSSRWLRHPSLVEPAAPFADLPAAPDVDPAGAVLGPPRFDERTPRRRGGPAR